MMSAITADRCIVSLDIVEIASPCPARWSDMQGDDRARHCRQCQLQVYNLTDMTRPEAEAFLSEWEGRTCVRFYRRADGTILTQDCPCGVALARRGLALAVTSLAIICGMLASLLWWNQQAGDLTTDLQNGPLDQFTRWIDPPGRWVMGGAPAR
jgi:hypothetical protein